MCNMHWRWVDSLKKHTPHAWCYHSDLGRSRSNLVGFSRGYQKLGFAEAPSLGIGCGWPLKTRPPYMSPWNGCPRLRQRKRTPKFVRLAISPLGRRRAWPLTNTPFHLHAEFDRCRSVGTGALAYSRKHRCKKRSYKNKKRLKREKNVTDIKRYQDFSLPGIFAPRSESSQWKLSLPGMKVPGNFRSWERRFPGTFVGSECSRELSFLV